jgi:hypothetical protein
MALAAVTSGSNATALSVQQIINLLTGVMTDQPVYVANTIRASTTGATAFAAFAGGTASGAPASGTHAVGEFILDQSGSFWLCSGAGTPGTWIQAGSVDTNAADIVKLVPGGSSSVAGSVGKAADAGHQHPALVNPGAGFTGNLILLQLNGSDRFKVDQTGKGTFAARVAATGLDLTADIAGVTSIAMAGALTGATTGSFSGAVTASGFTGNLTGTLQTAAQPNVTSLGTLSSLSLSTNASNTVPTIPSASGAAIWIQSADPAGSAANGDLWFQG